jgi:hypothetical protein
MKTFTAQLIFDTANEELARRAFTMMRETFCNDPELAEVFSSLRYLGSDVEQTKVMNRPASELK